MIRHETTTPNATHIVSEVVSKDDKVGLILRRNGKDDAILLQSIAGKASFFKRTNLQVGMHVLRINGISTKGITNEYAMKLLREETENAVVIVAQEYDPTSETNTTISNDHDDGDVVVAPPATTGNTTMVIPNAREIPSTQAATVPPVRRPRTQNPLLLNTMKQRDPTNSIRNVQDQVVRQDEPDIEATALIIVPHSRVTASPKPDPEGIVMRYASSRAIAPWREDTLITEVNPIQEEEEEYEEEEGVTYIQNDDEEENPTPIRKMVQGDAAQSFHTLVENDSIGRDFAKNTKQGSALAKNEIDCDELAESLTSFQNDEEEETLTSTRKMLQGDAAQSFHTLLGNSVRSFPLPPSVAANGRKPGPDVGLTSSPLDDNPASIQNDEEEESPAPIRKLVQSDAAQSFHTAIGNSVRSFPLPPSVTVTGRKPSPDSPVGLTLSPLDGNPEGRVLVENIKEDSIFVGTALCPGMIILSINGREVSTVANAVEILAKSPAEVTIIAINHDRTDQVTEMDEPRAIDTTKTEKSQSKGFWPMPAPSMIPTSSGKHLVNTIITKPTIDAPVGLTIADFETQDGRIVPVIIKKNENGLCAKNSLEPGMRILCIDGVATESQDIVKALLQTGRGPISIVAGPVSHTTAATVTKPTRESTIGIGVKRRPGHGLMVTSISPTGLFATTEIKEGMRILMINGVNAENLASNKEVSILCSAEENLTIVAECLLQDSPVASCASSAATTAIASCSSSATTEVTTNARINDSGNIITFAPPPGVNPGGQWGSGSSCGSGGKHGVRRCIRCSLFGKFGLCKFHKKQALYQSPSGRVFNKRGRHVGSTATTKFRHNPLPTIES